jgi:hypothetical protein
VDTIRRQCIGVSAHQKLELLTSLARLCGYESIAVFGDCFDEVNLVVECSSKPDACRPRVHVNGEKRHHAARGIEVVRLCAMTSQLVSQIVSLLGSEQLPLSSS